MTASLIQVPPAMADEYSSFNTLRETPEAFVYRAIDGLGEPVLITEFLPRALCQRARDGLVVPLPEAQEQWSSSLAAMQDKIEIWSRLVHPALCGIDQVFSTNGTVYVVTRDLDGQELHQLLPGTATNLEPRHLVIASERLIDLQGYLHAFGLMGLQIMPEALMLEDQEALVSLSLQRYLDGTATVNSDKPGSVAEDCGALARTLHCLLVGTPPANPHKPLVGRLKNMPERFVSALDGVLLQQQIPADFSARKWMAQVQQSTRARAGLPRWLPMAAGAAVLLLGFAAWFGISQREEQDTISQAAQPEITIPDAGPWQLELPLQIVRAETPEDGFMLRLTGASPEFMALNPWVLDGLRVARLNGAAVTQDVDLRAMTLSQERSIDAVELISLSVSDPDLPLMRDVAVIPYLWREKAYGSVQLREQVANDGWQLQVARVEPGATLPLRIGDVLVREQVANVELDRFSALDDLLRRLKGTINPSLTLMIRRDSADPLVIGFAIERLLNTRLPGKDL